MTIGNEKVLVSDFRRVYEKNLDAIDNEEEKDKNPTIGDLFAKDFKIKK